MVDFVKDNNYDLVYNYIIYSGIINRIDFQIKYGCSDMREELKYLVDRYCNEILISAKFLEEKLDEYNKIAEEKYGKKD